MGAIYNYEGDETCPKCGEFYTLKIGESDSIAAMIDSHVEIHNVDGVVYVHKDTIGHMRLYDE